MDLMYRIKDFFRNARVKMIIQVMLVAIVAYMIAFFVDQYYFLGKKWWFILELI